MVITEEMKRNFPPITEEELKEIRLSKEEAIKFALEEFEKGIREDELNETIMMNVKYERLTLEDLFQLGMSFPCLSQYSVKAVLNGEIIGLIALEDKPLSVRIYQSDSKPLIDYKEAINRTKSYYLRKIMFKADYRYSGELENLFDYAISKTPKQSFIWCHPFWDVEKYIEQIGGFTEPRKNINRNVLFYGNEI